MKPAIIIASLLLIIGLYIRLFIVTDSCLDRGGSYNYKSCECDFDKIHSTNSVNFCYFKLIEIATQSITNKTKP